MKAVRSSDPFSPSNNLFGRANVPNQGVSALIPSPNAPFRRSNVRFHTIVDNSSPFLLLKSLEESAERKQLRLFRRMSHFRSRMSRIALECPKMPVECPSTPLYPQIKKIGYYSNLLN